MAYTVRFETMGDATPFNNGEQLKINNALGMLETILAESITLPKCSSINRWFGGGNIKSVLEGLNNMHKYLTRKCTSLTFVSAPRHPKDYIGWVRPMVKVGLNPYDSDFDNQLGQSSHRNNDNFFHRLNNNAPQSKKYTVKETTGTFRANCGYVNVQSGLRIYLTPGYLSGNFDENDRNDEQWFKFRCVAHELSHRILDTIDIAYGEHECVRLAIGSDKRASLNNADNWGLFLAEIYKFRNLRALPN
ncbi:hypothetical protein EUZ85_08350 [Hahella sp. KA22]|uniref:M35 family metallo-endopeptidase n=1 Tax=Hahella sp. KA22 TaxID=1628392 RepID=UPI000FDD8886|nr:M35 family metallo-endopeptidase [Hahella sp. KA22]AZZ90723.1 hypothetical protein ENC22_05800 [Hahella sp. KA22]QAY54093.1 hypothetical protein EUZ85_08350 [Hahella sp. KA22]